MRACLHAWTMFLAILACSLSAGCSEVTTMPVTDADPNVQSNFGTIEKVSVMTTDGQEIFLNKDEFLKHATKDTSLFPQQLQKLKTEDVRFTLIVYRSQSAPFVLEVGPGQDETTSFYHWIRKETAKALFPQIHLRSIEMVATDLGQSYLPTEEETSLIGKQLSAAEYSETNQPLQFALYPDYRLVVDSGERTMIAQLLSPRLLRVSLGKEQLYYTVSTDLFSQAANWLPPQKKGTSDVFDSLFKATKVILAPTGKGSADLLTYEPAESSQYQSLLHETVRELKRAEPSAAPVPTEAPEYYLRIMVGETEHVVHIYGDTFRFQGKMYHQPEMKGLLSSYRQVMHK